MYEFKITVEIPGLPEAINALANAIRKGQAPAEGTQRCTCDQPSDRAETESKPVTEVQPDPTPVQEVADTAEAPSRSYTVEDLSNAGAALIDKGKMSQLIGLLSKYGVQAVTQLAVSQYPAFVEDMKALGAQF